MLTLALYLFGDAPSGAVSTPEEVEWFKAIPYIIVIVCAVAGMNVLAVLLLGIVVTDAIGLWCGSFSVISLFTAAGDGLKSMCELILVTLLAGGVMNLVRTGGGFDYLIRALTRRISGRCGAEFAIVALTALTNLCTANNTIAIITVGPIARDIATRYAIPARKSASLMDTASCFVQGVIPYGAQLLMASGLADVSPLEIIPNLYYPALLGAAVVVSIAAGVPKR